MRNAVKTDRGLWAPLAGAFLATLALCIACIAGVLMGNVSSAQADDDSSTLSSSSTTKIVINNVEDGATVTAYKVIEVNIDDTGTPADPVYYWVNEVDSDASSNAVSVAQWVKENYPSYVGANDGEENSTGDDLGTDDANDGVAVNSSEFENASASELADFYDALAAAIRSGEVSLPTANIKTVTASGGTATIKDVTMGGYFVLVSGGSYVYLPATVNVVPTYDSDETGSWVLAETYEDYAKRSTSDSDGDGVPDEEDENGDDGSGDDQMTITKTVTDGDSETTATTVAIGDTLTYSLTATVPAYPANALKRWFSVSDVLAEGLTLVEDSITVYGVDSSGNETKLTSGTNYTLTVTEDANGDGDYDDDDDAEATCVDENGKTVTATFTVLFDDEETTDEDGNTTSQYDSVKTYDYIYITYNVTVSEDVQPGVSYSNYAHLNYFSDPYSTEDTPDEVNPGDSEVTGGDEDDGDGDGGNGGNGGNGGVDVYTYGINLSKVDSTTTTLLAGAEFTLADSEGGTLCFVKIADGVYRLATSTTGDDGSVTYEKGATTTLVVGSEDSDTATNGFTSQKGVLVVYGLDVGTYSLTETAAPAGYAKLGSSIKVTIADDDADGCPTLSGKYTDTEEASDGYVKFSVKNSNASAFSLPSTGGPGTLILTIAGIVLIAAAIALCVSRKKKGTRA